MPKVSILTLAILAAAVPSPGMCGPPLTSEDPRPAAAPDGAQIGAGDKQSETVDQPASPGGPVPGADHPARSAGREAFARLIRSTAWVVVSLDDAHTRYTSGTAWLLDRDRKLLVTNHHVVQTPEGVAKDENLRVFFPAYRDGRLIVQKVEYLQHVTPYKAAVFDADALRDLALLQLTSLPDDLVPVPLAPESSSPGDPVHSLGNPSASHALWVYSTGAVRQVYRARVTYDSGDIRDFLRVETQSPTNPGDSGGPVVNDQGQVVAVNQGELVSARLMTYFIDVSELRDLLKELEGLFDPKSPDDFRARGNHYYARGRYDKAVADFAKAIELRPDDAEALANRGWAFWRLGDPDTATADFDAAIQRDPNQANYYHGRAMARLSRQQVDDAVADLTQAIRLAPGKAEYYLSRAEAYAEKEDYPRAVQDYSQAIRIEATAAAYYQRALCQAHRDDDEAAIADFTLAIQLDPSKGAYYWERAEAHRRLGRKQESQRDYFLMEQADPAFAAAHRSHFDRKTLRICNHTSEKIQVWLKYHTVTTNGVWKWFPERDTTWAVYTFDPGECSFVEHEGLRVNADQIRIWAGNNVDDWRKSTRVWATDEDHPVRIAPEEGYDAYHMAEYEYRFDE